MCGLLAEGPSRTADSISSQIFLAGPPHIACHPINRFSGQAHKRLRMAEERWRRLNGSELLPLVRAGVEFIDGEQVEREDQTNTERAAA